MHSNPRTTKADVSIAELKNPPRAIRPLIPLLPAPFFYNPRTEVFWMQRHLLEFDLNRYSVLMRAVFPAFANVIDDVSKQSASLPASIDKAIRSLEFSRDSLVSLKTEFQRRSKKTDPRPLVRYNLVAKENGRDAGTGQIANRVIECALDACRIHLAEPNGLVEEKRWAAVLNSTSGLRHYKKVYYDGCTKEFLNIELGLRKSEAILEMEMLRELFVSVDLAGAKEVKAVASQFMKGMEEGDINEIEDWLVKVITDQEKAFPENFCDWRLLPPKRFPLSGLNLILRRKLETLRKRLGYETPKKMQKRRRKAN